MRWWLGSRRTWLAGTALVLLAGALQSWSDLPLPIPVLVGSGGARPLAAALPALVAIALAICLSGRGTGTEPTCVRPIARYDVALVVLTVAIGALASLVIGIGAHTPLGAMAARNLLGYVGLVLIVGELSTWQAAGTAPVIFVVVSFSLGRRSAASEYPWAWSMMDAFSLVGLAWVLLLFAAGLALLRRRPRLPTDADAHVAI